MQLTTPLGWVRTSLDARWSPLSLSCREGGGLGRATTSLLLRSPLIQSLRRLLNQLVILNDFLYSQSIIVINANCCTHLSCSSWEDTTFDGRSNKRQVNGVLGNLMHLHYLGEVTRSDGTISPATSWLDYALAPDATYGTTQREVWSDF
jgi:hypothetical protein